MAGATLTIDTRGLDRLAGRFAELMRRAGDLTPMMDDIGAALVVSTQLRFETGAGPDGARWPESIRAREQGGLTLVDRGDLKDTLTHRAGRDQVEVGSNQPYGAIHQFGGDIAAKAAAHLHFRVGGRWARKKQVTIPARPYLGIDAGDEDEIRAIVEDYLAEPLRP